MTHISCLNDDVTVDACWLPSLIEAADEGLLPATRIEPAGGHVECVDARYPDLTPEYVGPVPREQGAYFFAGMPEEQPQKDWDPCPHANLPFCSVDQWRDIGPFPPVHYGTDRYFAEMGLRAGYGTVARIDSVAFNYNASAGRFRGEWSEIDFMDFDGVWAIPAYLADVVPPYRQCPLRETPRGLDVVRAWRRGHETGKWDEALRTDEERFELLRSLL